LSDLAAHLEQPNRTADHTSPWARRGWLLPQVILLHGLCPAVADRWGYHLRTLQACVWFSEQ
jgi:hypothetical protein